MSDTKPTALIEVPVSRLEPGDFVVRQYIGRAGIVGGAQADLSMDPSGAIVYIETDDAEIYELRLGELAKALLESRPQIDEPKSEGDEPAWPITWDSLSFESREQLSESLAMEWTDPDRLIRESGKIYDAKGVQYIGAIVEVEEGYAFSFIRSRVSTDLEG